MNKFKKVVAGVRKFSSLLQLVEAGLSTAEIKKGVIETLEPYFQNHEVLELAIPELVPEAVSLVKLQEDSWALKSFKQCLETRRLAQAIAGEESLRDCALWEPTVLKGLSNYWSALHLEVPKSELSIEEFTYEAFRNIGTIIEGPMQPYLRELLHQVRLVRRISKPATGLNSMDLGDVVAELVGKTHTSDIFKPPPWGVRLNQWRNIAQHLTFQVEDEIIVCWYGKETNIKEIRLSRNELWVALQKIYAVFCALKLSRTIFFIDNVKVIEKFLPDLNFPPESEILSFASSAAVQGFEVVDVQLNKEQATAILLDVSDLDPNDRKFHASQFAYLLWACTNRPCATVEYREKNGTRSLITTAWAKDCERISRGEIKFCELANLVELIDLKTGVKVSPSNARHI